MTTKETWTHVENSLAGHRRNGTPPVKNRFRIFVFAAIAPLCFLMCASSALAESKTRHARGKSDARSRRPAEKKRSTVKLTSKIDKRGTRQNVRETASRRELTSKRERASRTVTAPAVRKTVIISSPQLNNRNAPRPALVNDIVIISLAEETPVTSSLSPSAVTRPVGSSANMPSIWPVDGPIRGGFGMRSNPFGGRGSEFHKGQDIHATYGSPVIATADGMVVQAGWLRGYGQVVYIDHGNGISTRYGHLSRIDVTPGMMVKRGDQLGLVGSTGRSTGPHLHYEVRIDGQATNPIPYLPTTPAPTVTTPSTVQ